MPVVEERVAYLEGQAQQLPAIFASIREEFTAIRGEFSAVRAEMARMGDRLDSRMDRMEDRMNRQFMWTVGIQVTTLVAVVTALISALLVR
jgi:hypothetical protein